MKFFWPIYLSSLVLGTAGVYVAAPYARPYVSSLFGNGGDSARPAERSQAPQKAAALPPRAAPAPRPAAAPQAAPEEEDQETEISPALRGVFVASYGDRPGWGITQQRATYYKLDGSRIGSLSGGVLFDCSKAHQSSKGLMVECALTNSVSTNDHFLISRKDVFLFTGAQTNLSSRQLEALHSFYEIKGKIGARKTDLLQASAVKNPHFSAANEAYRAFTEHTDKARELAAKRNTATELDKARLEDQLRELKVEETRLRAELAAANEKFRAWKEQHANEVAKPENDPDVQKWTQQLEPLRTLVPGLAL